MDSVLARKPKADMKMNPSYPKSMSGAEIVQVLSHEFQLIKDPEDMVSNAYSQP